MTASLRDTLLRRMDSLENSHVLLDSEREEVRRQRENLELAESEDEVAHSARWYEAFEKRVTTRPPRPARVQFRLEYPPTKSAPSIPEGSTVLISRRRGTEFEALSTSELYQADREVPNGFVVILSTTNTARPLWRFGSGNATALDAGIPRDNWCLRLTCAINNPGAFEHVERPLQAEQIREFFRSMTDEELKDQSEQEYNGKASRELGKELLDRFRNWLEKHRKVVRVDPDDSGPREWPQAELISSPSAAEGWQIPLDRCSPIHPDVNNGLKSLNYRGLYLHQLLALNGLYRCHEEQFDVILTTPTASGKTLAFLPGILGDLLKSAGNALFLYPLRALCNDQVGKIQELRRAIGAVEHELHAFYDQAALPRQGVRLLAATPDKINAHLDKEVIQAFLGNLRWIVIDEAHVYKGCFGINVAFLLRRLLYFAPPTTRLVLASATLDNTVAFARRLTGRDRFRVISGSGAPRHPRHYSLAKPNANAPLRAIVDRAQEDNSKGLIFVLGRSMTQQRTTVLGRGLQKDVVFPFYSGVNDYQSRLKRLREEGAAVAITTSSLEAGVDLEDVRYLAICSFPRSRGSFLQMAGRAGRKGTGHVIFIPADTPADLFYARPEAFRGLVNGDAEPIYLNPLNQPLMEVHLKRFAHEARNATTAQLLDTFLGSNTTGELRAELEQIINKYRSDSIPASVPSLRAIPGVVHVILRTGTSKLPSPPLPHLKRSDAEECDSLIEVAIQENARREWPPESIAMRDNRYYLVERWDQGKWLEDSSESARASEAVFIWVRDITSDLLCPEDYRQALSGKTPVPEGKEVAHYHQAVLHTGGEIEGDTATTLVSGFKVVSGRGPVSVAVRNFRLRSHLEVNYRCPRWSAIPGGEKLRKPSADKPQNHSAMEWYLNGRLIEPRIHSTGELPTGMRAFKCSIDGQPHFLRVAHWSRANNILRIDLEEHLFSPLATAPCSCGSPLESDCNWVRSIEPAPPNWWSHPTYLADRRFESDLAKIQFPDATPGAILAISCALIKVMPEVMFLDPGDIGAALMRDGSSITLLLYDVIEGGSGICSDVPRKFEELLSAAERLLRYSLECPYCQGMGCFGCLEPREPLRWPQPDSTFHEFTTQEAAVSPSIVHALALLTGSSTGEDAGEGGAT